MNKFNFNSFATPMVANVDRPLGQSTATSTYAQQTDVNAPITNLLINNLIYLKTMKYFNSFFNNSKKMAMTLLCIIYVATVQSSYAQNCTGILAAPVTVNGVTVTRTIDTSPANSSPVTDVNSTLSCFGTGSGSVNGYISVDGSTGTGQSLITYDFSCPVTSFEFYVDHLVNASSISISTSQSNGITNLCTYGNVQTTAFSLYASIGNSQNSGGRFRYFSSSPFTTVGVFIRGTGIGQPQLSFGLCGSSIVKAACVPGTAPTLSATTKANTCPATTVDLTTITATNLPAGTTLTWHTGTPATTANKVTGTAQAAGTYYASFFDANCGCYSNTTAVTATVSACATGNPVGNVDAVCTEVRGWAYDPSTSSQSIDVHVYVRDAATNAVIQAHLVQANLPRSDVNTAYGITGNHGYSFNLRPLYDGQNVKIEVFAINIGSGGNTLLAGSGATCNVPPCNAGSVAPSLIKN